MDQPAKKPSFLALFHLLLIAVDMAVNFPQNYDYVTRDFQQQI